MSNRGVVKVKKTFAWSNLAISNPLPESATCSYNNPRLPLKKLYICMQTIPEHFYALLIMVSGHNKYATSKYSQTVFLPTVARLMCVCADAKEATPTLGAIFRPTERFITRDLIRQYFSWRPLRYLV